MVRELQWIENLQIWSAFIAFRRRHRLLCSRVPLDDIRRFGRWESCVFHRYIHHGEMMYHGLSRHIARTEWFLEQLRQTNSVTKAVRIDEDDDKRECRTGRREISRPTFRTGGNHTPSSDSEMDSDEVQTNKAIPTMGQLFPSDEECEENVMTDSGSAGQVFSVITREITQTSMEFTPVVSRNASTVRFNPVMSSGSCIRYKDRWDSPEPEQRIARRDELSARCRGRWDSPELERECKRNPGLDPELYPSERVFPVSDVEADPLDGLVAPFIRTPSPEHSWVPVNKCAKELKDEARSSHTGEKKEDVKEESRRVKIAYGEKIEKAEAKKEEVASGSRSNGRADDHKPYQNHTGGTARFGTRPVTTGESSIRPIGAVVEEEEVEEVRTRAVVDNPKAFETQKYLTYNVPMDVGAVAHWVNWSFDAGRQFQARKFQEAQQLQQYNVLHPINAGMYRSDNRSNSYNDREAKAPQGSQWMSSNITNPPGLQPMTGGNERNHRDGENHNVSMQREVKPEGGKGTPRSNKGKGKLVGAKSVGSVKGMGTQSNASSKGSSRPSHSAIKNASKQRSAVGGISNVPRTRMVNDGNVSARREDKRERLEHVKTLLDNPDKTFPNPNLLVNDSESKQELRKKAWELWERLDSALDEGPSNPEYGFDPEVVKMAKMGVEFI